MQLSTGLQRANPLTGTPAGVRPCASRVNAPAVNTLLARSQHVRRPGPAERAAAVVAVLDGAQPWEDAVDDVRARRVLSE
jgi:hypothetical protein